MGDRVLRVAAGWLVVVGLVFGVSVWSATPAAAHNSLTGSDPRDGARLAKAPARVELRFLARLDPKTTKITLTGPDNMPAARGGPTFDGSRVRVALLPGRAGLYTVGYEITSSDGHPIRGEVRFTLTTGTPADPTPSADPSGSPAPVPSSTGTPTPADPTSTAPGDTTTPAVDRAADAEDDDGTPVWPWVLGVVALLAALVGGLLLRRRATPR